MKRLALIALLLLLSTTSFADQYLCIADQSTEFFFNEKSSKWEATNFNVENNKFIISKLDESEVWSFTKMTYKVTKVGTRIPLYLCEQGFNDPGYLRCKMIEQFDTFSFNRINGRYIREMTTGYVNVVPSVNDITDKTSNTPYIEIGKCSPF